MDTIETYHNLQHFSFQFSVCVRSLFCYEVLCVLSRFVTTRLGSGELIAFFIVFFESPGCYCTVSLLQDAEGGLQCVNFRFLVILFFF